MFSICVKYPCALSKNSCGAGTRARAAQPQTTLVLCSAYSLLSTQALDVNNPGGGFGGDGNCARCINLWVACTLAYSPHNQKSNLCVLAYARLNRALNYMHCVKVTPARVASVCFGFCQRGWRRGATANKQTNKQSHCVACLHPFVLLHKLTASQPDPTKLSLSLSINQKPDNYVKTLRASHRA